MLIDLQLGLKAACMHSIIRLFPKRLALLKLYLSLHTPQTEIEMLRIFYRVGNKILVRIQVYRICSIKNLHVTCLCLNKLENIHFNLKICQYFLTIYQVEGKIRFILSLNLNLIYF